MSVHRDSHDHTLNTNTSSTNHHYTTTTTTTTAISGGGGGTGRGGGGGKGNKTPTKDSSSSDNRQNWKKDSRQTPTSKSKANYHSSSSSRATSPPNGGNGAYSSRYYYREMPPRFQSHNKKTSAKTTSSTNSKSQGSKKSKDTTRWPSSGHTSVGGSSDNCWSSTSPNHSMSKGGESVWGNTQQNESSWSSTSRHNHWMSDEGEEESFSNSDPITDEIPNDLDSFTTLDNKTGGDQQKHDSNEEDETSTKLAGIKKLSPDTRHDVQSPESIDSETGHEGGGVWRSGRNSMGSTSSVGSNSSWKGSNSRMGGSSTSSYQRSNSPRKQVYSTHRSVSVSGSSSCNNGRSSSNRFAPKKKPVMDLDDAMESLHGEPSGWGDLPSPKQSGIDMGTEVWGIPDDVKQKMKKERSGASAWGDGKSTGDWSDDRATNGSGWIEHGNNFHDSYQWTDNETGSWNTCKGKDQTGFGDKVKTLVDMGFSPSSCEKALKMNNDNFEAALGDLLALTAIKETDGTSSSPPVTQRSLSATAVSTGPTSTALPPVAPTTVHSTTPSITSANTAIQQQQPVSTTGLDLVNLQQILGQQLGQYRLLKQKLMIQMSQLKSTALTTQQLQKQQQFLTANLNQVNAQINTVYQQWVAITKLIQQKSPSIDEKDTTVTRKDTPPVTISPPSSSSSDILQSSSVPTSTNELNTSLQSMSLEQTDITKTSARTLSRLQQIISGNSQESENDEFIEAEISPPVTAGPIEAPPIAPPTPSSLSNFPPPTGSRFSTVRSVDEIPEFKPGVPWNPNAHIENKSSSSIPSTPSEFMYDYQTHRASTPGYNSSSQYASYGYEQSNYTGPRAGFPGPFNRSSSYSGGGGGYRGFSKSSGYNGTKLPPPPSPQQQSYPAPPAPLPSAVAGRTHHRPRLMQQNSYSGPFSTTNTNSSAVGAYRYTTNHRGQPQYGGSTVPGTQHGSKWSYDGNPWGMPPTSGSIWSMESSDSILNSTAVGGVPSGSGSGYSEWRSGGRKPSLPLQLSAPTSYILLKNVTAQIDENSLREVCSEYGQVLSCSINPFNESVLIRYSNKDEAAQAKAGLEKNPSICGVFVSPNFASEIDIASFTDLRTPSHSSLSLSSALEITSPSWLHTQQLPKKTPPTSLWGNSAPPSGISSSDSSTGSVWSNGGNSGTLVGLTNSPWSISPSPQQQQQQVTTTATTTSHDDGAALCSTSPPLSTFLPNGLF